MDTKIKEQKEDLNTVNFKPLDSKKHEKLNDGKDDNIKDLKKDKKESNQIEAMKNGMLVGKDLEGQYRLAKCFVMSKMVPRAFDTPEKVLTAMQYSYELGLKPLTGMRQIAIINGIPSIYGDLPLAMVESSGLLEDIEEYLFDKDYKKICLENKNLDVNIFGAFCRVKRKNRSATEKVFTIDDAVYAKLLNPDGKSNRECWAKYPKLMLKYRARSMALKDSFSDVLSGIAIAEYDYNSLGNEDIKEIDQEKEDLLDEVTSLIEVCKNSVSDMNDARILQLQNKYIKNQDIRFAEKESLIRFRDVLKKTLEN